MEMLIDFPGGARVDAHFGPYTVMTDQPLAGGGSDSAPAPFLLFLASIGTCAGIYVLGFCKQRQLPIEGIKIIQHTETDRSTGRLEKLDLEIQVPTDFPEKYYQALVRSAEQCKVKQTIDNPPKFNVYTRVKE